MYRPSLKIHALRRVAVLFFFGISILFLVSSSLHWSTAQAGWRVEVREGETASSSLSINNRCAAAHSFRIDNKFKSLRFNESTEAVLIEASGTKSIGALFDAKGLKSKLYRGKVDVECLDCKKEQGCSQDRDELAIEMNVIKAVAAAGLGAAKLDNATQSTGNPQLTLNKIHVKNANDPVSGPPAPTTWQPGVPITYVISLENSGAANPNIMIADPLPPGFVLVTAVYTAASGATGPTNPLAPPPFGPFNIPMGGKVEVRITGYFTSAGPKINTATATAKDNLGNVLDVGTSNSSSDQLSVSSAQPAVNVKVTKSVTPTSTSFATTLPFQAHMHYTIVVTNTTATDVYLGGNLRLKDIFSSSSTIPLAWTVSPPVCSPSGGAVCPDMPASVAPNSGSILFPYDASGASAANDNGWLPGNGSYKIEFDVDLTKNATCGSAQVTWSNQARLESLSGFSDLNPGDDNSATVSTTVNTGLSPCAQTEPAVSKIQCSLPTGPCVSATTAAWNTKVRYQIKVSNPTNGTLTNVPLNDFIWKGTGTPTFTATVATGDPHCISGCTALTAITTTPVTITADGVASSLWSATLPSLGVSVSNPPAVIEYIVQYDPLCETDDADDGIVNRATAGGGWNDVTSTLKPAAQACKVTVDKTKQTPGPIVFGQPTTYQVVFSNSSAASLPLTVRDALSISSSQYGSFNFTYSTSCTATAGTVTPLPAPKTNVTATASYQANAWQGLRLIDDHPTFGPMSTLTCQVTVTAQKPPDTSVFCQGDGNPQLRNAAYVDESTNYNPSVQPTLYDVESADLPLCRSVIVGKTTTPHSYGPGASITYNITAENKGKNPVTSFVLKDAVPLPLVPVSVSSCPSPAVCTLSTLSTLSSIGQLDVTYGVLQPGIPVTVSLLVTAPQAGGSYKNTAVGSFLPGGNYYFQGDESQFLQQEENIQVLTPNLSKRYDPVQIGANGTSTLTFNVTNTNSDPKQTGISFSDTLPAGLQIVSVISNGCSGNVTTSTDGHTVTLTGGQLVGSNADGSGKHSCQISIKVKASDACGLYKNNKENFSQVANLDVSNINEQLEVAGCSPGKPPTLTKKFEPAKISVNGTTSLAFTITNSSGDPKQTGIAFSDTLPPGLQIVGVSSNGCSGNVTISPDGHTVTLSGGQLIGPNADGSGQHSCQIVVKVKATGECATYRNNEKNFSEVKNLDVSGIDEQLIVGDCGGVGGLTVQKDVKGAPKGFTGQFNFLVQCATPNGFYQKAVTVNWPTPGFTVLNDVPAGSQCTVTEGPPPASLPASYNWAGLPAYFPQGGVVSTGPRGGQVVVTDTMGPCNESGQVTITKVVEGLPKDFIGTFEGTLQCWVSDKLVTYPVTLTSPNGLSTTIGNIPLGSTCTFQETGQAPLKGDLKWNQPIYAPKFGTVTLTGECCQQITVTNQARHCCSQTEGSGPGTPTIYSDRGTEQKPVSYPTPPTSTPPNPPRKEGPAKRPRGNHATSSSP